MSKRYSVYRGPHYDPVLVGHIVSDRAVDPVYLATVDPDGMICDAAMMHARRVIFT